MNNERISYKVIADVGTLVKYQSGWSKEVDIIYYSREEIERAREMDLLTYLRLYEPENLVHVNGNVYSTREHDSLKISNGKWMWWSREFGGASALDYLIKVKGISFPDAMAIICNDEGKMNGMQLNRAIYLEDGQMADIIAGPFFIAYAPVESEKFLSMPKDLEEKYTAKFRQPEQFFRTPAGIKAVKYEPEGVKENELEQR